MFSRVFLAFLVVAIVSFALWFNKRSSIREQNELLAVVDGALFSEEGEDLPAVKGTSSSTFVYDEGTGLDVTRKSSLLNVGRRKGGLTYLDTLGLRSDSDFTILGKHIQSTMDMNMSMETKVEDLKEGGQAIEALITHITMTMSAPPIDFECDTDEVDVEQGSAVCETFYEIVGKASHYVVDDEGTIAEGENDALLHPNQGSTPGSQLQASNQLKQTARLLKLVPTHPVKPGDTWDASSDMGDMGEFSGNSTLMGYKIYKGRDCAVIATDGSLSMDISKALAAMGGDSFALPDGTKLEDSTMKSTMYYDYKKSLPRWSETEISMTISMLDPITKVNVEIPSHQIIRTETSIKDE